jgi:hypothetical protein
MRAASAPLLGSLCWDDGGAIVGGGGGGASAAGGDDSTPAGSSNADLRAQSSGATATVAFQNGAGGDDWAWSPVLASAGETEAAGIFNTDRDIVLPYKLIIEALHTGGNPQQRSPPNCCCPQP